MHPPTRDDAQGAPQVTFLIATRNRRAVLLHTLGRVCACGLEPRQFEIIIVDNASTDGTADAVHQRFPRAVLVRQTINRGSCAKNLGLAIARGEFIVFLDDDSFPRPGSVSRMIGHFRADPGLGAAVFAITLPDGKQECIAYPDVCIGCGTGFRRQPLLDLGGLPQRFFMAAEEYDLSLRLLDAGWRIRRFDDLHATHLKTPQSRFPRRTTRLDARNNVLLAMQYFPGRWRWRCAIEWLARYRLMAIAGGHRRAFWIGAAQGLVRGLLSKRRPIRAETFEQFARIQETQSRLQDVSNRMGLRKVLFVDLGKNVHAYHLASRACGLDVVGIADARLGGRGLRYRGLPILSDAQAAKLEFDAAIISNLSPVQASERLRQWSASDVRPVVDLFAGADACQARSGLDSSFRVSSCEIFAIIPGLGSSL